MKRWFAFLIAAVLILSVSAAFAVPKNVEYRSTRRFLELLDEKEIKYTYTGVNSDDLESVKVSYNLSVGTADVLMLFNEDNEHCSLRVWNLIDFDESRLNEMYAVCNALKSNYKYCSFYVDESDFSVSVSMDLIYRSSGSDEICYEALLRCVQICDDAMEETLQNYRK